MAAYSAHSDQELLERLQSGDERAFGYVYEKFYSSLCFFSVRLTGDTAAAEDIVQEILCKLWQKHADFSSMDSIKGFLYISTRNACMNHLTSTQRKEKQHIQFLQTPLNDTEINEVIYTEALREIAVELDNLPDQCAKVIRMMYQEGLKPQEIADRLGVTVSTVYNQKMRGIAMLKSRLSGHGFEVLGIMLIADRLIN